MNGRAAFAPDAMAFIQSLPDNGKLTIRTTRSDGKVKEGNFDLGPVSEFRSKIAHACVWDDTPNEPVGSVDHSGFSPLICAFVFVWIWQRLTRRLPLQ